MQEKIQLHTIEEGIADIRAGRVIIVVDDENRENEGDFVCAAECVTPEIINFMATHGRGLVCTPLEDTLADALELPLMVTSNTAMHETAFTVSIDLIGQGCSTGISAYDRATGIRAMVNPDTQPSDFARPGHIFPLRAKTGGVLRRTGHTEATVDLARLAGFYPAGVLVEILNEDGTMARLPQLVKIAEKHDLKIISIDDLIAYRMRTERIVRREISVNMPTKYGNFEVVAFTQLGTKDVHLAIKRGTWKRDEPVMVRVQSSIETDDVLLALFNLEDSDFHRALAHIATAEKGVVLYMRHGEKVPNLVNRLKLYAENKAKNDKVKRTDAVMPTDLRDYGVGAQILRELGISKIRLLTTHPQRRIGMIGYGLEVVENVKL
jgi:3,4-dihydroxy 2-butanone 4-phosphate synthase / GTP cyclohydrolase II